MSALAEPRPLWSRKLDIIYLVFFVTHVPIILLIDITPFYPAAIKPRFLVATREWYIKTYHDRFFEQPPAFFTFFLVMEAMYHLPFSIWAIAALLRDDRRLPARLLIFACQAGLTTATCIASYLAWPDFGAAETRAISTLYVPYMALAVLMGVDMLRRLDRLVQQPGAGGTALKAVGKRL